MKFKTDGNQTVDGGGNLENNLHCTMCIVPVKVNHGDGKDMITTYVTLDNCSQGSFIHDNLVKELGGHDVKTILHGKNLKAPW